MFFMRSFLFILLGLGCCVSALSNDPFIEDQIIEDQIIEDQNIAFHMLQNRDIEQKRREPAELEERISILEKYQNMGEGIHLWAEKCSYNLGLYLDVSFLYWQAENNGWIYAIKYFPAQGHQPDRARINILFPDFDMAPGSRVTLGFNSCKDRWDLITTWTYYHNKVKDTQDQGIDFALLPILAHAPQARSIRSLWRLNYNMFDFEVGKQFYIFSCVSMRFHFGPKGGRIDQEMRSNYDGYDPSDGE